jgi:hypothetical protein
MWWASMTPSTDSMAARASATDMPSGTVCIRMAIDLCMGGIDIHTM